MQPPTARQYGEMMRHQGILFPAPAIDRHDLVQTGVTIHSVGRRALTSVFVLERRGWATVYVDPRYSDYRAAFDAVMPDTSKGRDVDHLFPKSQAPHTDFLALGRIGITPNRGWNDDTSHQAMAQKVRNMTTISPHAFVSRLKDMERGWAVITCYIRPISELNTNQLRAQSLSEVRAAFG